MTALVPDAPLPASIPEPTFDQTVSLPVGTSAVVYCEGQFGEQDGKTANGLVRHSEKYEILSVIDSHQAGVDAGAFLDGTANGIPVLATLAEAISHAGSVPDYLICGVAPADGLLSAAQRTVLLDGIARGMHVINGLHEFLNDDPEFVAASLLAGVTITDVRRPKEKRDLHLFSGRIFDVTCPRIAVLGTDGAIGKRTTTTLLVQALNDRGIKAVMVGTGQTTLIQGGKYGVALDALVPQFCSGEVENQVVAAFEGEDPDIIIVEGQGALSHPAYMTSAHILRGSRPAGVIVQHAPGTRHARRLPDGRHAHGGERGEADRVVHRHEGHRHHRQPREPHRRRDRHGHRRARARPRAARHRPAHPSDRAAGRHGAGRVPGPRLARCCQTMTAPRLEIDLEAIAHNTRTLVSQLEPLGIGVTGITKAALGSPGVGAAMLSGGATGLGDSRVENLARLRTEGVPTTTTLIRSPMVSQADACGAQRRRQPEHGGRGHRQPGRCGAEPGTHPRRGRHGRTG